jgi:hypothetical protein
MQYIGTISYYYAYEFFGGIFIFSDPIFFLELKIIIWGFYFSGVNSINFAKCFRNSPDFYYPLKLKKKTLMNQSLCKLH